MDQASNQSDQSILIYLSTYLIYTYTAIAQPALLYLVPACLGSSFLLAIIRGEVTQLLAYSEEHEHKDQGSNNDTTTTTTTANTTSTTTTTTTNDRKRD